MCRLGRHTHTVGVCVPTNKLYSVYIRPVRRIPSDNNQIPIIVKQTTAIFSTSVALGMAMAATLARGTVGWKPCPRAVPGTGRGSITTHPTSNPPRPWPRTAPPQLHTSAHHHHGNITDDPAALLGACVSCCRAGHCLCRGGGGGYQRADGRQFRGDGGRG